MAGRSAQLFGVLLLEQLAGSCSSNWCSSARDGALIHASGSCSASNLELYTLLNVNGKLAGAEAEGKGPLRMRGGEASGDSEFRWPTTSIDDKIAQRRAQRAHSNDGGGSDEEEEEGEETGELTQKMKQLLASRYRKFASMVRDEQATHFQKISNFLQASQARYTKLQQTMEKLVAQQTESTMVLQVHTHTNTRGHAHTTPTTHPPTHQPTPTLTLRESGGQMN
jgi:hypothetical protein